MPAQTITNQPKTSNAKSICIVGMMGVGKTTFGKKLAKKLKREFFDVDVEIENEIGHTIEWIFENAGEQHFRKLEESKVKELLELEKPIVIALGGGAFINENTRARIKQQAISVWLDATPEVILNRVKGRTHRPLLNVEDKMQQIVKILETRRAIYAEADLHVRTDEGTNQNILDKIIKEIKVLGLDK
jgi:shikimate kinase